MIDSFLKPNLRKLERSVWMKLQQVLSPLINSYLVYKLLHLEVFLVQCANHEDAGIGFIIYLAMYLVLMYVKMYGKCV